LALEREAPDNNRMQLTGSARGEGGHAPLSQLIQVFDGHERRSRGCDTTRRTHLILFPGSERRRLTD
jgi:hypothetical protein